MTEQTETMIKNTIGLKIAMKYFDWDDLDKIEKLFYIKKIHTLADLIDDELAKSN